MASPSEVKAYLKQRRRSSLSEMAVHFGIAEDTVRALLEPWLLKNKVHRIEAGAACSGSCSKSSCCGAVMTPVYEWCETQ
jgi:putative ferrous iron transport protein C